MSVRNVAAVLKRCRRNGGWNQQIIAEFRANDGKVGGDFEGAPMVLVHHAGAKTGTERVTPLMFQPSDRDRIHVFASKAGATDNPDWYHNLLANPSTKVELPGRGEVPATVSELTGADRNRVWEAQKAAVPQFADYEESAGDRLIPVLAIDPD